MIRSARTRRAPEWDTIADEEIVECMQEQWMFNYTAIMWSIWIPQWRRIQEKNLKGTRRSIASWFAKLSNEICKNRGYIGRSKVIEEIFFGQWLESSQLILRLLWDASVSDTHGIYTCQAYAD